MPVAQTRLEILQVHKLLQCVRAKDKAQLEKLCSHGVPHLVNYSEPEEGETALHLASRVNDEVMVRFLLDIGAHPNVIDLKGRTAAMRAAEFGHVQTLEILATAGSDMKVKDTEGKGILFYCILPTSRHARCTDIVIENGAECNNVSNAGVPLLVVASLEAKENEDICIKLLEHGADPNSVQPSTGRSALNAAAGSGSVKVVKAILSKGGDVNTPDKNKLTPAHRAAMRGHFEVLQILASYGADFSTVDVIMNSPVHYAAEGGHALCCRYLAQRGAKAHLKNEDGLLPKAIAKNYGFKDALKECKKAEKLSKKIASGAKVQTEIWAVRLYDWAVPREEVLSKKFIELDTESNEVLAKEQFLEALMSLEAPISEEEFKALFLLHDKTKEGVINYSDFLGGKKYVHKTYLLSAYSKKEKKKKGKKGKKKKGKTKVPMPICLGPEGDRTERGGPPPVFIERHVPFTDTGRFDRDRPPLHPIQDDSAWYLSHPDKTYINVNDAAKMGDLDSLKQAYVHGRNVDARDKYFKTALMIACSQGNAEITKFLLHNGAQVNTCDNFKWSSLHHACLSGQLDIVQMLVDRGADMNAQALNGGTPLMRAIQTGAPDIVQYLINKGCNVTLENRKGETAMDVARWWADPRVLQIVSAKFDTIAPPKDGKKKKGKKSAGKKGGDGAKRAQSVPPIPQGGMTSQPSTSESPTTTPRERKGSVLRAASAMAGGIEHHEDITYVPLKAWNNVPNTRELIIKKEQRRARYGDGIDFPDYRAPFKESFMKKSEEQGGVDSDDD